MNDFEKELKKTYEHGTQKSAQQKDSAWYEIARELEKNKMNKKKNNKLGFIIASAVALLIILGAVTPAGQAAVSKILSMFAPEKNVVTEIEGETEEKTHALHTPAPEPTSEESTEKPETQKSGMTYVIYIDESNYEVKSENGIDVISPLDYPDNLPEVSMTIYQVADKTPEQVSAEISATLNEEYDTVKDSQEVQVPIEAIYHLAYDGLDEGSKEDLPQWDSDATEVYLVDNTQSGTYVIQLKYFMEAAEGHGERLKAMLGDFEVVPTEQ
jgi:hypothetical protein